MAGRRIDGGGLVGDWGGSGLSSVVFNSPLPSPRTLFPLFMPNETLSLSAGKTIGGEEEEAKSGEKSGAGGYATSIGNDIGGVWVSGRRGGSIAERRAAKSGFNAARLNTARFRTASPMASPAVRSPYITIPPGLSPTTLLDSPVMLLNSLEQPSPTTGTFLGPSILDQSLVLVLASDENKDKQIDDIQSSLLVSKCNIDTSSTCPNNSQNQVSSNSIEIVKHLDVIDAPCETHGQTQPEADVENQAAIAEKEHTNDSVDSIKASTNTMEKANSIDLQTLPVGIGHKETCQFEGQLQEEDSGTQLLLEGDVKDAFSLAELGRLPEDEYNWRKYGQKQVKGSEFPCSYYKRTHPNCQVKENVKRSHDAQVSEFIYKDIPNHPKPQMNPCSAIGSGFALNEMAERTKSAGSLIKVEEGSSVWRSVPQQGPLKDVLDAKWRYDGIERTSTSGVTDISDPSSTTHGKDLNQLELVADTPDFSSNMTYGDDDDDVEGDRSTDGSISLGDNGDNDESDSKRRKNGSLTSVTEANLPSRAAREPRVVVQTTSEVDVLDDGYRWRKYGQKVVKGNPNPRSYYKCTSPGCPVRKHVERACHDIKSVITTYEGKHNHEVPAARNSSHGSSGSGNLGLPQGFAQPSLSLPRVADISKPQTTLRDFAPRLEPNEYLKAAAYLRNLSGDIKAVVSPGCDMRLPSLHSMPCAPAEMNGNLGLHPLVALAQRTSNLPGPFQVGVQNPGPRNLALPMGFGSYRGKAMEQRQYLGRQQNGDVQVGLFRTKEGQKDETLYEERFDTSHPPVYNQIMGRFPL